MFFVVGDGTFCVEDLLFSFLVCLCVVCLLCSVRFLVELLLLVLLWLVRADWTSWKNCWSLMNSTNLTILSERGNVLGVSPLLNLRLHCRRHTSFVVKNFGSHILRATPLN